MKILKQQVKKAFAKRGYWIGPLPPVEADLAHGKKAFVESIAETIVRSQNQTKDEVDALKKKYEHKTFGKFYVWDLVDRLSKCIDTLDDRLGVGSQEVHALQVAEAMEDDGLTDPHLLVMGIIHDLGKVLLMDVEPPENVYYNTSVIAQNSIGLDNCTLTWCQDEFLYSRIKDHAPDHVSWVIRYHGLDINKSLRFMDERDKEYTEKYLRSFKRYDGESKSFYKFPKKKMEDYRDMIEYVFPNPILF